MDYIQYTRRIAVALSLASIAPGCDTQAPPEPAARPPRPDPPKPSPRASATVAPPPTAADGPCSAPALHTELMGYCDAGAQSGPPGMVTLPWAVDPGKRPVDAVEISMTSAGRVHVDGSPTAVGDFADLWRRKSALARQIRPTDPISWSLGASPNTPVDDVAKVLAALAAGGANRGFLVFSAPATRAGAQPRDKKRLAAIHAKVHSVDMSQKATILATLIQKSSLTRCAPLVKVFGAMAGVAADEKCEKLARGVADGFPKCRCQNADEIMTLLYAVMADTQPPKRRGAWIPVVLSATARPVTAKKGAPWSGFVSQLDQAALPAFRLGVQ